MKNYILQVLIALDQLGNTLLGGWADETMSSRASRDSSLGWRWLRAALEYIQPGHCANAFAAEHERRQMPPELR